MGVHGVNPAHQHPEGAQRRHFTVTNPTIILLSDKTHSCHQDQYYSGHPGQQQLNNTNKIKLMSSTCIYYVNSNLENVG